MSSARCHFLLWIFIKISILDSSIYEWNECTIINFYFQCFTSQTRQHLLVFNASLAVNADLML